EPGRRSGGWRRDRRRGRSGRRRGGRAVPARVRRAGDVVGGVDVRDRGRRVSRGDGRCRRNGAAAAGRAADRPRAARHRRTARATLLVVRVAAGRGIVPEATVRWARRRRPRDGRVTKTPAASTTSPITPEPIDGLSVEGRQLAVAFGGIDALAGVDITVEAGSCHAVIGPNGSGKTTLLRVLAGVVPPDRGHVVLGGNDVTAAGVAAGRRAGLARTLQRPAIAAGLTPRQHVVAATEAARRDNR